MTSRGSALAAALLVASAMVPALGCRGLYGGARLDGAAPFSEAWPTTQRPYKEVYYDWTRRGRLINDYDRVLEVSATFKSTEWRSAYVARRGNAERLPQAERNDLAKKELAEAREFFEIQLLVRTYRRADNDLQKNERSRWRIVLIDQQGNQIEPVEIRRDQRPQGELVELFLDLDAQHKAYIARFPRTTNLMEQDEFSLLIASLEGSIELFWSDRE